MTQKDLVDFGRYLLSKERAKTLLKDCPDKREVYHSDIENWEHKKMIK
jgi:hypothetical protein